MNDVTVRASIPLERLILGCIQKSLLLNYCPRNCLFFVFLFFGKVKTVMPAEAVAQLVGGLTTQLKDKEVSGKHAKYCCLQTLFPIYELVLGYVFLKRVLTWWALVQEERAEATARREAVEATLHSTRSQFDRTKCRLKRFQVIETWEEVAYADTFIRLETCSLQLEFASFLSPLLYSVLLEC